MTGVEMDPAKVQLVMDWKAPKCCKQLQSFLGFTNFYWQFIPLFAWVALLLTNLLKTKHTTGKIRPNQPLQWTLECKRAFETLKVLFAKEPILKFPDPE